MPHVEDPYSFPVFGTNGKTQDIIRTKFRGTSCPSCLLEFHSRYRLYAHLKYGSQACSKFALAQPAILSHQQAEDLDALDRMHHRQLRKAGRRINFAASPALRLPGPPLYNPYIFKPSAHHHMGVGHRYLNAK